MIEASCIIRTCAGNMTGFFSYLWEKKHSAELEGIVLNETCIGCQLELAPWERNRSECLDCREKAIETYGDDFEDDRVEENS